MDSVPDFPDSSAFYDRSPAGSQASNFQSLGAYSEFLRSAMADEESRQMSDDLQGLAVQVEAMMVLLQQQVVDAATVAQALLRLVGDLRSHRTMLLSLGADWHQFYEFDAHFSTVNQFRIFVTRWAAQAAPPVQVVPSPAEFDVAAWRLLGAGAMLLDEYEQSKASVKITAAVVPEKPLAPTWWQRVQGWWRGQTPVRTEQRKAGRRGRRQSD